MEKIKILFIARGNHLYGDNRSLLQLLLGMRGFITPIVCLDEEGLMTEELKKNGIAFTIIRNTMTPHLLKLGENRLFYRISRFPFYLFRSIVTYFQLLRIVNKFKPAIVHSNNSFIYAGCIISKVKKIPHVWHLREYIDKDHDLQIPRKNFFLKNIKSSRCIAISRGVFQYRHLQENKDVFIYNGIFSESNLLPYRNTKEKYFLFSGRLIPTKGLLELVETFMQFLKADKSYKLIIAGEGDENYLQAVKARISAEGMSSHIEFLGFVKDLRPLMVNATALIVPSYYEALGRVTAEAMLLGCFVIGKDTAGTKELLENDNSGILYDTNEELLVAMEKVASFDEKHLSELNIRAKEFALKRYTSEINAKNVLNFYHSVLDKA